MKHVLKISSVVFIGALLFFTSCKPDEPKPNNDENASVKTVTINAKSYSEWVYFSFSKGKVVDIENFSASMDWDIAFHRFDVRTNCGASGPGNGGTYNAGQIEFESLLVAPDEGYSLNDTISIIDEDGNWENPTNVPGDTVLATWLTFSGPPPTYNISNNIYVVKTADGKYAKVWLKDYYNDESQTGYVTMKYFYQADGSKKLQ